MCLSVETFESPFLMGGEDARVFAFMTLSVVEKEYACVCIHSWLLSW